MAMPVRSRGVSPPHSTRVAFFPDQPGKDCHPLLHLPEHRKPERYADHMGRKHIGPLAPGRARTAERRKQALQLRAAGVDFRGIAAALNISVGQAYADCSSAMAEVTREAAEEVLALDLQRLDQLQASVWPAARSGDIAAVNAALKIIEMRERLFGNLRSSGLTVNANVAPPLPPGSVLMIGGSKSEYVAGLRAARGELLAPPAQNGLSYEQ
jgi:hypothetical protein